MVALNLRSGEIKKWSLGSKYSLPCEQNGFSPELQDCAAMCVESGGGGCEKMDEADSRTCGIERNRKREEIRHKEGWGK